MCREALACGVRAVVATPRWGVLSPTDCERKLERLRRELRGALSLKAGFLVQFRADLAALLERHGASVTLGGGRYVLVSLPPLRLPEETEEVWEAVQRLGFQIVVARPECSPALRRSPSRLRQWVASGVKLQLDGASIVGAHGREVKSFALECAREHAGGVVVASNASAGRRSHSSLRLARAELAKRAGERRARLLFSETPAEIIRTETDSPAGSPAQTINPKLLSRLRSLRLPKIIVGES